MPKPSSRASQRPCEHPILPSPKWHDALFLLGATAPAAPAILCHFSTPILAKGADQHSRFAHNPFAPNAPHRRVHDCRNLNLRCRAPRRAVHGRIAPARAHPGRQRPGTPPVGGGDTVRGIPAGAGDLLRQDTGGGLTQWGRGYFNRIVDEFVMAGEARALAHTLLRVFSWGTG